MAGGKILVVLGGLVAAAVAAGIWLVMAEPGPAEPDDAPEPVAGGPAEASNGRDPAAAGRKPDRKKARVLGTCTVTGVVKRRQGDAPAAGQAVQLLHGNGSEPYDAAAGADGTFHLEQVADGGPYELRIESKGFATIRLPGIVLTRGEERDVGTLWLDQAVQVPVLVTSWGGTPVEGATVGAYSAPDATRTGWDWNKAWAQMSATPVAVATVTTGPDGKAVFPEMATGTWTFTAKRDGFATDGKTNVRIESGGEVPVVRIFLPSGNALKGRVLDGDKKPIPGVLVLGARPNQAWDLGSAPLRARSTTDAEGRYELTALPTGDIHLQLAPAGTKPYSAATVRVPGVSSYDLYIRSGGSVTGTVVETGTGKPIAGVTVRTSGGNRTAEAETDASGKYVIAAVPDAPLHGVHPSKEGWLVDRSEDPPMQSQIQVNPGDTITRDFKMKKGAKVTGVVSGASGPVAGARVQIWTVTNDNRGTTQSASVQTDAEGRYSVEPVERGRGLVHVQKTGFVQKGLGANIWNQINQGNLPASATVEVPETGEVSKDVVLDSGARVEGKVESAAGPVAGARVNSWSNSGQGSNTTSNADGTFVLEGLTAGTKITVNASKEGFLPKKQEQVEVLAEGPTTGVVVTLVPQAVIRGKVTSAAGLPLRDVQVSVVMKQQGAQQPQFWDNSQNQRTGTPVADDGSYETTVPWLAGSVAVVATSPDHAPGESAPVALVEGGTEYTADVVIEAGYTIRGRVSAKGAAVAGADITLSATRQGRSGRMGGMMMPIPGFQGTGAGQGTIVAVTDAEGLFAIEHVTTGSYTVSARADDYVAKSAPNVSVPSSGDVSIELEASLEIAGRVAFADGRPVAGATLTAQQDDGKTKPEQFNAWGGQQAVSGPDGSFRFRNLSPGNFRLSAMPPWDGSVNFRAVLTETVAAGTSDYKVTVQGGGTIRGTVVDPERKPVGNVWVYANPANPEPGYGWRGTRTKEAGTFELTGLGDGPYHVTAYPPQFGDASSMRMATSQNVAVGSEGFELALEAGLEITGQVLDAAGKPLPDVALHIQAKPDEKGQQAQMNWNASQATTDAEGRFRFRGLGPGKFMIQIQQWGGGRGDGLVLAGGDDVAAGSRDVSLSATSGEKIAGTVVDEAGQGIANAWVYATPTQGGQQRNARTDKDGRFEITGLARGTVTIGSNAQGRPHVSLQKVETGTVVLRIVMPKGGSISGRLTDAGGAGWSGQQLHFRQTDGGNHNGWAQTGADGRFTAEALAEGAYDIYVNRQKTDGSGHWEQVKVGSGRTGETVELKAP